MILDVQNKPKTPHVNDQLMTNRNHGLYNTEGNHKKETRKPKESFYNYKIKVGELRTRGTRTEPK